MIRDISSRHEAWVGLVGKTRLPPRCLRKLLAGTEMTGCWGRGRLYLTLRYHHQNDFCIKMGSDESRFNVSLTVRSKVTRQMFLTDHNF